MKVVFLYTELADYFLKCAELLATQYEVHIFSWPVNKEAPFVFETNTTIKLYSKSDFSLDTLQAKVASIAPNIIVCSGWIDKDYLKIVKLYKGKIPTVLTCDTHWKGTLKQRLAVVISRFFLLDKFSHAWVPGEFQHNYVKKLGFKNENIRKGFYVCDLQKFNSIYSAQILIKQNSFPKRFIYVGRYYDFKGIEDLWKAFIDMHQETPNEWELWCLGTGNIQPIQHPKIKHFGFVQPKNLEPLLEQTGVFVLPSRYEPWGVVVQEYASAGFPMILSDAVGAKEAFLLNDINGFEFKANNVNDLKLQLKKIINLEVKDLLLMAEASHAIAQRINQVQWTESIKAFLNGFK